MVSGRWSARTIRSSSWRPPLGGRCRTPILLEHTRPEAFLRSCNLRLDRNPCGSRDTRSRTQDSRPVGGAGGNCSPRHPPPSGGGPRGRQRDPRPMRAGERSVESFPLRAYGSRKPGIPGSWRNDVTLHTTRCRWARGGRLGRVTLCDHGVRDRRPSLHHHEIMGPVLQLNLHSSPGGFTTRPCLVDMLARHVSPDCRAGLTFASDGEREAGSGRRSAASKGMNHA